MGDGGHVLVQPLISSGLVKGHMEHTAVLVEFRDVKPLVKVTLNQCSSYHTLLPQKSPGRPKTKKWYKMSLGQHRAGFSSGQGGEVENEDCGMSGPMVK